MPSPSPRSAVRPVLLALLPGLVLACHGQPESIDPAEFLRVTGREAIVGLPCEGCEAVFEGLPGALLAHARIAPAGEPGEPLCIQGVVRDARASAVPGVIVYAYHTDAQGIYPSDAVAPGAAARRHGRLRGWARTDADGRYRFDTIRPAGYPGTDIPQHVHMHVLEPGRCTYYIDDILFEDDPRLTPEQRGALVSGRGGVGLAVPQRDAEGGWHVKRDISLGLAIPGYPERQATPGF